MTQKAVPAVFMRGGTSKGVFFHGRDLPEDRHGRDTIFCAVIGSPDPYGRQLDGMGGGISSLSKVVVIEPSDRPGIDVDYTFGQVVVDTADVDYGATCGNLSSAVGPFAVDEGLVLKGDGEALVRVHNINTDKVFEARFPVMSGKAQVLGEFIIPGVSGSGALVQLEYLDPGGARTGALMPTNRMNDHVGLSDGQTINVCCVDATTPCVFVAAADLGLNATENPLELESRLDVMTKLEEIRCQAGVLMGLGVTTQEIRETSRAAPRIAVVAAPADMTLLDGSVLPAEGMDIAVRMVSMGVAHRAVPLTGGMCLAVAANLQETLVHNLARDKLATTVRLGSPSGVIPIGATIRRDGGNLTVDRITTYRTARRLMEGNVLIPG